MIFLMIMMFYSKKTHEDSGKECDEDLNYGVIHTRHVSFEVGRRFLIKLFNDIYYVWKFPAISIV